MELCHVDYSFKPLKPMVTMEQPVLEQAHRECAILQHKMALNDVLTDLKLTHGTNRAEKNERIERVLAMIAEAKRRYALPIGSLAAQMGLSPATLTRWRRRLSRGQAAGRPTRTAQSQASELKRAQGAD